jgi:DNA-binding GntR family transcriptional regulator
MPRKTPQRRTRPPAQRKVAADERIYSAICDAILERRMPPGTRLQEIQLGEFFGVSRTVAHRALLRLAHEGIVSLRPKRVAVVARPSIEETRNVFAARRAVESAIVPLVMRSAASGLADKLRVMVDQENAAYARGDRATGTLLSVGFHLHLADLASNPVLAKYVRELVLRTSLIVALYESPSRPSHPHLEHADIVEKIAAGNEKAAVRAMIDHLEQLEASLELRESEATPTLAAIFGGAASSASRPTAPAFAVSGRE